MDKGVTEIGQLQARMHERTAFWVARLRADNCSHEDLQNFALWLSASPAHQQALDSMLDLWDDLAVIEHMPEVVPAVKAARPKWSQQLQRGRSLGLGLAAVACTLFVVFLLPRQQLAPQSQYYQTAIGEQQSIELADGSAITLNTDTHIEVTLLESFRKVVLKRGEAYFEVEKETQRPFIVDTGNAEVRVIGTAFNIHRQGTRSDITVTEGVVRVTEKGSPNTRAAVTELLYTNQRLSSDSNGLKREAAMQSSASEIAWRDGKFIAEAIPLAELVKELSRYHPRKILIAEPALAQTKVSGVFDMSEPNSILTALAHSIGVNAMVLEDDSILLIKTHL